MCMYDVRVSYIKLEGGWESRPLFLGSTIIHVIDREWCNIILLSVVHVYIHMYM